jgi:4-hydroxybenzoate polyprenyltransferase
MTTTAMPATVTERVRTYASFVRFEHTLFSLPLLIAGVFSATGPALGPTRWALIAIAAVGARTAALAMNRLIDRRLDALNPRTVTRELPSGAMSGAEAWALLLVASLAYLAACAALGAWYLKVAVLPLAVFAIYPYLKRWTPLCHLGVGTALALSPLAGYAAAHPDLARPGAALWLAGFALCWVTGFDIIYATLDEAFDREYGVHSLVVRLGRRRALAVSALLHAAAFACVAFAGYRVLHAAGHHALWGGWATGELLLGVGLLLLIEQKKSANVDLAFFKVNVWVGFFVLAMVLAARAAGGF